LLLVWTGLNAASRAGFVCGSWCMSAVHNCLCLLPSE